MYDDFDYFLQLKDEAEVLAMCSRCEISKYVHVQKILSGWLAETKCTKIENKPSTVPSEIPEVVQALLIPSPNTEMQNHFNNTVRDIFEKSYNMFSDQWQFKKYVVGQRQMRYNISSKISSIEERINTSHFSKDGQWINVHHFLSASINEKNIVQARNTIGFLEEEASEIEDIRKRRCHVSMDLEAWQVSEVQFYDAASTRLKDVKNQLIGKKEEIAGKVRVAERCVNERVAKNNDEARKKRNREASKRKEEREKKERAKLQA